MIPNLKKGLLCLIITIILIHKIRKVSSKKIDADCTLSLNCYYAWQISLIDFQFHSTNLLMFIYDQLFQKLARTL